MTIHRRQFLHRSMLGSALLWTAPGAFAEALTQTPAQTEGPFYPDKLPLDTDNDLLIITDKITPAVGEVSHLHGTVRDAKGEPVRNALVEIWQVDHNGNYIHTRGAGKSGERDANFQGYGRFSTNRKGEYYFRTIKPVPYVPRTPHIHVAVTHKGKRVLTTQCYVKGEPLNAKDGIYRGIKDAAQQASVTVEFKPLEGSEAGELAAQFDIVLGLTPADPAH
ncbi:MAG: protocatechuate 3,4-dioxygenase [Verrucomicrobiales bacterium]